MNTLRYRGNSRKVRNQNKNTENCFKKASKKGLRNAGSDAWCLALGARCPAPGAQRLVPGGREVYCSGKKVSQHEHPFLFQ